MASASKDTVYIDIDDEITSIIDKLKSSDKKIVALVLPKRSAVLQSIVNMKLLKHTADNSKKSIVLITSEAGLMPLAGAVGVHVAKTLQSKPSIPAGPQTVDGESTADDIDDVQLDEHKPIGELAEDEAIQVDNDDKPGLAVAAATKAKGNKKIKIPNFDKFRLKVVLGVLAVLLLLVGGYFATQVMPKAKIVIKTDSSTVDSQLELTVSTTATEVDETNTIVPGQLKELKKDDTETVPATGQIDKGTKATGKVTLTNCSKTDATITVPAGSGVSNNGLTFITKEAVTIAPSNFTGTGVCKNDSSKDVNVTAQSAGDRYNISGDRTFSVSFGGGSISGTDSTAMTGGTTQIVKVVSQKDIDDAKQKMQDRSEATRDELLGDMEQSGLVGLRETFAVKGNPVVITVPNVNEEAAAVKVTQTTIYTLLGAQKEGLKKVIEKSVEGKIDTSKQVILDNGLDKATIVLSEKKPNGDAKISLKTQVLAGPQLDENSIKQEVVGKKKSQTISIIKNRPGIEDVQVSYSPFWVSSTPKKTSKITVIFEQKNGDDTK